MQRNNRLLVRDLKLEFDTFETMFIHEMFDRLGTCKFTALLPHKPKKEQLEKPLEGSVGMFTILSFTKDSFVNIEIVLGLDDYSILSISEDLGSPISLSYSIRVSVSEGTHILHMDNFKFNNFYGNTVTELCDLVTKSIEYGISLS